MLIGSRCLHLHLTMLIISMHKIITYYSKVHIRLPYCIYRQLFMNAFDNHQVLWKIEHALQVCLFWNSGDIQFMFTCIWSCFRILFGMPEAKRLEPLQGIIKQEQIHREGYAEPVLHPESTTWQYIKLPLIWLIKCHSDNTSRHKTS